MKPKYSHIHFIGIKGVAMTALAILAKQQGSKITGSDIEEEFITDEILKRNKINWKIGFSPKNISGKPDLVVVTGAHGGMTNPEAQFCMMQGFKTLMQGKALGMFMEGYEQISVVGCHGKTTTSALIAALLDRADFSPSYAVGCADIPLLGNPAKFGKGKYFVAEADEYVTCPQTDPTPRFMWQNPQILVVTNIEFDHPDVYQNLEEVKTAFKKIMAKVPSSGKIIACLDNPNVKQVTSNFTNVITYGQSPLADYRISKFNFSNQKTFFWLNYKGRELGDFQLSLPGEHNVYNATASIIAALETGVGLSKIKEILPQFLGTKRRFEKKGETKGILFYDDYAHHPTEIKATLKSAKLWFPGRKIFCIFQPHTYSRTLALLSEFGRAFSFADAVIVTDIYSSSRERKNPDISAQILIQEISKFHPLAIYQKTAEETAQFILQKAQNGDIVFTMGAGDIYKWNCKIINYLKS